MAQEGHEVTYLTLRQWDRGERGEAGEGVRVLAVGPRMALYSGSGRRRILPPLVFGLGVLWHLPRHGRRYDVVDTCSFPYFSLLAAALLRPLFGYELVVDWFEVWSALLLARVPRPRPGASGCSCRRLCARVPQRAHCFSELHAAAPARRGPARPGDGAARAARRRPPRPRAAAGGAGGAVRRAPDPREACRDWRSPRSRSRPSGSRGCGA